MPIDRREFLAGLGGLGAGLGLGGVSHWLPLPSPEVGPDWSPGDEEFVTSTCLLCPSHCGIRGRVVDGKLVRIDGNPLHPVSEGGLCPKGRAGIQLLYHPGRLVGPVERTGEPGSDQFRRLSWEEALSRIAGRLSELRAGGEADSVAWLTGHVPGIMGELLQRFAGLYGTPHVIREDYADGSSEVVKLCQGIDAPPAFDLAASDLVLSFGAALSEAWWCLPQAARARAVEAGRPRWVQIDVRHSRTAARADQWVGVRPGTYGTLALGLAYVILKEGLYDAEKVHDQVLGLEDWRSDSGQVIPGFRKLVLRYGRTRRVSERTGVPEETLVRLAKAFGTASRPVAVWDQSVSWRTGGLSDALAIHALNILVSALNRRGGMLVQPRLPLPPLGEMPAEDVASDAAPTGPPLTPGDWASRIATETPNPVQALLLYHANPVASSPDAAEVVRSWTRVPATPTSCSRTTSIWNGGRTLRLRTPYRFPCGGWYSR
jgi:anaerobic selenocysteine-containing dehydrogenase